MTGDRLSRKIHFLQLIENVKLFDKSKRHPLIIENPDFAHRINPMLLEWAGAAEVLKPLSDEHYPFLFDILVSNLRIIIEIIYYLGYHRGQKSKGDNGSGPISFVVVGDEE